MSKIKVEDFRQDVLEAFTNPLLKPTQCKFIIFDFHNKQFQCCATGAIYYQDKKPTQCLSNNDIDKLREYINNKYDFTHVFTRGIENGWDNNFIANENEENPEFTSGYHLGHELWKEVNRETSRV